METPGQRAASASDAIVGVAPRVVFEPSSRADCVEVFGVAHARGYALACVGGATELGLGASPERLDAIVTSRGLDRVIEYAPADQVITVEAGMTLGALQRTASGSGQRLACDPPLASRATVGGVLSTNAFGPLRTRFGSLRDLVIGISILRADGTVVRGGGKVVKNVAGFDLPKLAVGALGTLGMVLTATFRLHPLPEVQTTLRLTGLASRDLWPLVLRLQAERVEPVAVAALGMAGGYEVLLRFEGFPAGVGEQRNRARARLEHAVEELPLPIAAAAWADHDRRRTLGDTRVKLSMRPSLLSAVASSALPPLTDVLSGGSVVIYPTLGLCFVSGEVGDPRALGPAIARARASLVEAARGQAWLVVHDLPGSARQGVDVWGPVPPAFALMTRVKARFDPERRLNPGRFVGNL